MNRDLPITDRIVVSAADLSWRTSRAGGPGGQHVNTTDTRVQVRFELEKCEALAPAVKERLRRSCSRYLTRDGALVLACAEHRSRQRNVDTVRERLAGAIRAALVPPKKRRPTRPSRASKKRRLDAKSRRSKVKSLRGRVRDD